MAPTLIAMTSAVSRWLYPGTFTAARASERAPPASRSIPPIRAPVDGELADPNPTSPVMPNRSTRTGLG